jgi:hypothetical protein
MLKKKKKNTITKVFTVHCLYVLFYFIFWEMDITNLLEIEVIIGNVNYGASNVIRKVSVNQEICTCPFLSLSIDGR